MLDKVLERAIKNVICNDNVIVILSFVRQKKSLECGSLLIQSYFTAVRVLQLESLLKCFNTHPTVNEKKNITNIPEGFGTANCIESIPNVGKNAIGILQLFSTLPAS